MTGATTEQLIREGVRGAIRECLFFDKSFNETSEVRYRAGFDTACWMYRPPHVVVIGLDVLKPGRVRLELTDVQLRAYVANYYHHEMAHARYTTRAGRTWVLELEEQEVPFSLYNLFEDARCEHLYARETGRQFNWTTYERPTPQNSAQGVFFALVQAQGRPSNILVTDKGLLRQVLRYYQEAIKCRTSEELMPLLIDWIQEFPHDCKTGTRLGDDLAIAFADEDEQQAFLDSCAEIPAGDTGGDGSPDVAGRQAQILGALGSSANELPDRRRTEQLCALLRRVFESRMTRAISSQPSRRLSIKHFVRKDPRFYRQPKSLPGGKQKLLLLLDCSGSMKGRAMAEARILLSAFSQLCKSGHLDVTLLLSATLDEPSWQRLELPLTDLEISRVHACGSGEALQATLLANIREVTRAHAVFVFTDADLKDAPVNKSMLNKRGVYTTGLYVGSVAQASVLERYFDRTIVRDSIEEIGLALIERQ